MNKKALIYTVTLIASLAFMLYTYWPMLSPLFSRKGPAKPAITTTAPVKTDGAVMTEAAPPALVTKEAITKKTAKAKAESLTDPFSIRLSVKRMDEEVPAKGGASSELEDQKELRLEGVWYDSGMKVAFISGQALLTGGEILGWRVATILKETVILERGSQVKILRMGGK